MTCATHSEQIAQGIARRKTKFVAGYYLLTIVASTVILFFHGRLAFTADLIAALFFLAVTILLYDLSQPTARSLRLLVALVNFVEIALRRRKPLPHGRTASTIAPRRA